MFTKKVVFSSYILMLCMVTIAILLTNVGAGIAMGTGASVNAAANALGNYAIVFVSRKLPTTNGSSYYTPTGSLPGVQPWTRFQVAAPGKLIIREANGTFRVLIDGSNPTAASLNLIDVNAPNVSYDATKIIFAGLPTGSYSTAPMTNPNAWRIYMINVNGTGLKQITFSDRNINLSQFGSVASSFTSYDDTDPAWLPDGRIVFSSTRWPSFGQYGGARTTNLHVVNADGTGMHRITAERNGAERPIVDPVTGRIVYSRWWRNFRLATNDMGTILDPKGGYIMKDGLCSVTHSGAECTEAGGRTNLWRNAWHLATINPDGTGLAQFAGGSNSFLAGELGNHAYGGSFAPDGSFYTNFFPMTNGTEAAGFGGIRRYQRGANGYASIIGITTRDESVQKFVNSNPPSYGVYVGNYAAEPEVLPDGRLVISWAANIAQDYGLYTINSDGSNLTPLYDNVGTTELRTRLILPRTVPPIITDKVTAIASLLPPLAQGPYNIDGTFTFKALNVYFNAPVDTNIISAIPVGSANSIRFFIDHQRSEQRGSFEYWDWPILLNEVPVNADGSVTFASPANVPLFEQIRSKQPYNVPLTGQGHSPNEMPGAAHVAGMNFGRPGEVATCVGCHAGHTMIPVPANPNDAQWTNLAPGATVAVSSTSGGSVSGINDRRVKMNSISPRYWASASGTPSAQWVKLTFPVPVTVRTVRLYNIFSGDSSIKVLNTTVQLFSDSAGTNQVASTTSGALSENGTDVAFNNVVTRVVKIQFTSVNGSKAGLGEVEVIASGANAIPVTGNTGVGGTTLRYNDGTLKTITTDVNGNYAFTVPVGWSGAVVPYKLGYTFTPVNKTYSAIQSNQTSQNYTAQICAGCADVNASIGGTQVGGYTLGPSQSARDSYPGVNAGPVKIFSTNAASLIGAERMIYKVNGVNASYSEMVALPDGQLSTTYWLPWYNNVDLDTQLRFGNVSGSTATVHVYIGGAEVTPVSGITLLPGASTRVSYAGVNNGPVNSTNTIPLIGAERVIYAVNDVNTSFSEMMALPNSQLGTTYWLPWYNNVDLDTQLRFGNVSGSTATVHVYIGGAEVTPVSGITLLPGASTRVSYAGVNNGPVQIVSDQNIVASERVIYKVNNVNTSFSEMMALPDSQLSTTYWLPWYNNADLDTQLRFGNVSGSTATVHVYIGGAEVTPVSGITLLPGASTRVSYAGVNNGPVQIVSDQNIVASERVIYKVNELNTSFSEMMALPNSQLNATYWLPWYNNLDMDTQLRFGAP